MLRPASRQVQRASHHLGRSPSLVRYTSVTSQRRSESTKSPSGSLNAPSVAYTAVTHPISESNQGDRTRQTLALAKEYVLPVYARPPIVLERGKGSWVWDCDGRKYLDFTAGIAVNALGHADDGVSEVLRSQSSRLLHTSNAFYSEPPAALASLLITLTRRDGGLGYPVGTQHHMGMPGAKAFFCNSGTEANEGALKVARKVGKDRGGTTKIEIVCFEQSFHGRSLGALSVTSNSKYQDPFSPLVPGIRVGQLNRSEDLENLITENTCAVIVEPIQGEGGVNSADVDWMRKLVRQARDKGAVVIFDEIQEHPNTFIDSSARTRQRIQSRDDETTLLTRDAQCGLYRTGTLWAHSSWPVDCHPDIVTMAKPLANGYPLGAVLMQDAVAETMTAGTHGTTFGGSPLACSVGYHVLSQLSRQEFVRNMMGTSALLLDRLERLSEWFPNLVGEIRGRGLMIGLVMRREGDPQRLVELARERGLLLLTCGKDCVRLVPSLNVKDTEVSDAVDVIESCLGLMY